MMSRTSLVLALFSVLGCTPPAPRTTPGTCANEVCTEAQRCDGATLRCVTNELPKVVLVGPTTSISDTTFEVTGTVTDDTDGTILQWRDGVAEWRPLELNDGAFTITVPARELDTETMMITVQADDGTIVVERSILVIVDRIAPTLELTAPAVGAVSGGDAMRVTIIARDGSDGLQDLTIAGQRITSPRTGTELSAQVSIPAGDRRAFPVEVVAKDLNGNRTAQTFQLQVDGLGPSLRFVTPVAQTINTPSFRVEVEAADPSAVQQVRIAMEDGGFIDAAIQDGGTWTADFAMAVAERSLTFTAEATDSVGNVSSLVSPVATLDRIAPTVEVLSPATDSIQNAAFDVVVLASADAATVNAIFAGITATLTRGLGGSWSGQMPFTLTRDYSPESLVVVARDAAGNDGTSAPTRLYVDTVAPTLTFTTPSANAKLNRTNFGGGDDVTVAWQVQDADPQASTTSVGGLPSTANDVRITTLATDDGRAITTTVVAADRRGNSVTGSLTFSVDRVAPTIVSWLPAANARNVEPRTTTLTFSERVTGPTTASDATNLTGSWDAPHTTWTSAALAPYSVFTATLSSLTDDSGNPVAAGSRKFHTSALVPASGTVLATGVTGFTSTSDNDGVLTVAVTTSAGYRVFGVSPTTGVVLAPSVTSPNVGTFSLNSSVVVDPVTLVATHWVGSARYGSIGTGPFTLVGLSRHVIVDGVGTSVGSTADALGAVVSQGAFSGEADSTPFALIEGTTYLRGSAPRALPSAPNLVVAQAGYTWAGFSTSPTAVVWSRFLCIANLFGSSNCTSFMFNAATSNPTQVHAAITPNSRCLVATWMKDTQATAAFQPLMYCDEPRLAGSPPYPSCQNGTVTAVAVPNRLRVAPFQAAGETTMLGAYDANGIQLGKMSAPTACTNSFTAAGAPFQGTATAFEPVQLGNKPALLYIDAGNRLTLYVP